VLVKTLSYSLLLVAILTNVNVYSQTASNSETPFTYSHDCHARPVTCEVIISKNITAPNDFVNTSKIVFETSFNNSNFKSMSWSNLEINSNNTFSGVVGLNAQNQVAAGVFSLTVSGVKVFDSEKNTFRASNGKWQSRMKELNTDQELYGWRNFINDNQTHFTSINVSIKTDDEQQKTYVGNVYDNQTA